MGDESLVGIVDLMTGEKDPRNLMIVFSILRVVMVEWDITNHVEVLACRALNPKVIANGPSFSSTQCTTTFQSHLDLRQTTLTGLQHRT